MSQFRKSWKNRKAETIENYLRGKVRMITEFCSRGALWSFTKIFQTGSQSLTSFTKILLLSLSFDFQNVTRQSWLKCMYLPERNQPMLTRPRLKAEIMNYRPFIVVFHNLTSSSMQNATLHVGQEMVSYTSFLHYMQWVPKETLYIEKTRVWWGAKYYHTVPCADSAIFLRGGCWGGVRGDRLYMYHEPCPYVARSNKSDHRFFAKISEWAQTASPHYRSPHTFTVIIIFLSQHFIFTRLVNSLGVAGDYAPTILTGTSGPD